MYSLNQETPDEDEYQEPLWLVYNTHRELSLNEIGSILLRIFGPAGIIPLRKLNLAPSEIASGGYCDLFVGKHRFAIEYKPEGEYTERFADIYQGKNRILIRVYGFNPIESQISELNVTMSNFIREQV